MMFGLIYNRYAQRAHIRMRARILKNFCGFRLYPQNYTLVQKLSSKYDVWVDL